MPMKSGKEIPEKIWQVIQGCLNSSPSLRFSIPAICAALRLADLEDTDSIDGHDVLGYASDQESCLVRVPLPFTPRVSF